MTCRRWLSLIAGVLVGCGVQAGVTSRGLPALVGVAALTAGGLAALPLGRWCVVAGVIPGSVWLGWHGPWRGSLWTWGLAAAVTTVAAAVVLQLVRRPRWRLAGAAGVGVVALLAALSPTRPPTEPVEKGASVTKVLHLRNVDRYVIEEVEAARIPGAAVVVVQGDRVVYATAIGDASGGRAMTATTPVVIGSTTKSITALAVAQLVEDGRLSLDAPIQRYLSWFAPRDPQAHNITVRDLLIDTSGIPTWAGWKALAGDGRMTTAQLRRLVNRIQLTSRPGARFQYSNANYIILGDLIEAVSGEPYDRYVQHHIFESLAMTDSRAGPQADAADGYRNWLGYPVASHLPFLNEATAAGYTTSSAHDLARYLAAQLNDGELDGQRVLSAAGTRMLHHPEITAQGFGAPAGSHYAMGWYVGTIADEHAVFHSGDVFDSSSSLVMLPERNLGVVVVANSSNILVPVANTLAHGVTARLLGRPAPNLGRSLAIAQLAVAASLALFLTLALLRARNLWPLRVLAPVSIARVAIIDVAVPLAVVLVPPVLFGRLLDRAEHVGPIDFWRIAYRGIPDLTVALLVALGLRAVTGTAALAVTVRRRRTPPRS